MGDLSVMQNMVDVGMEKQPLYVAVYSMLLFDVIAMYIS